MLSPRCSMPSMMNVRHLSGSTMASSTRPLEMPLWRSSTSRSGTRTIRSGLSSREIQRRCEARRASLLAENVGLDGSELGVGIGIDSGSASFGEFGRSHRDLTAIGTVVNTAARAQAAADAGRILVTRAVYDRAGLAGDGTQGREYQLKGFEA